MANVVATITIYWETGLVDPGEMQQAMDEAGKFVDTIGQQIIDAADPPILTGFLNASAYINSSRMSTFGNTWETGFYTGSDGRRLHRERADSPEEPPDENGCAVGWAAAYAWIIEEQYLFISNAVESVRGSQGPGEE